MESPIKDVTFAADTQEAGAGRPGMRIREDAVVAIQNEQVAYESIQLELPEISDPYNQDPYFPDPYVQF